MSWWTASEARGALTRTAAAAGIAGVAVLGAAIPAHADPGCDYFGWRHPLCAGGAFDDPAGGVSIPQAPSMVPNIDGTLSLPGTPGAT